MDIGQRRWWTIRAMNGSCKSRRAGRQVWISERRCRRKGRRSRFHIRLLALATIGGPAIQPTIGSTGEAKAATRGKIGRSRRGKESTTRGIATRGKVGQSRRVKRIGIRRKTRRCHRRRSRRGAIPGRIGTRSRRGHRVCIREKKPSAPHEKLLAWVPEPARKTRSSHWHSWRTHRHSFQTAPRSQSRRPSHDRSAAKPSTPEGVRYCYWHFQSHRRQSLPERPWVAGQRASIQKKGR